MKTKGFTFINLLIAVSLSSLSLTFALPACRELIKSYHHNATVSSLATLLRYARGIAIQSGVNTVICPISDKNTCDRNWHGEVMLFIDYNNDGAFSSERDDRLRVITLRNGWNMNWRAFGQNKRIHFGPQGYDFNRNGTVEICPPGEPTEFITTLVVNKTSRIRRSIRKHEESKC